MQIEHISLYVSVVALIISVTTATKLSYYPVNVTKRRPVTLICEADEPDANVTDYTWYKNGHLANVKTSKWYIEKTSLDFRTNFTCVTTNRDGTTSKADTFMNITAPPALIDPPPIYRGVLFNSTTISLNCRFECYPLCSVRWFHNGQQISFENNPYYYEITQQHPADLLRNDFESVESTLVWNLTNWPNQQLSKDDVWNKYTCGSQSDGPDLNFTIFFEAHFPPENLTIGSSVVNVIENEPIEPIKCTGEGRPYLVYNWRDSLTGSIIAKGDTLQLDKLSRFDTHRYTCEGYNRYGSLSTDVYFNVLYKPDCTIELTEVDGRDALLCKTDSNLEEVAFQWDTDGVVNQNPSNILIPDFDFKDVRTYTCIANNSIGVGTPCQISLLGKLFKIELHGEETPVEGATISLDCDVHAGSPVEISWFNGGKLLEDNILVNYTGDVKSNDLVTKSRLLFTASPWNDEIFKCSATTSKMRKNWIPPVEKELRVTVLYAPKVRIVSPRNFFMENRNKTADFFCSYSSNPIRPVDITWYKNGKILKRIEDKHIFNTFDLSLTIRNVSRSDIGTYKCGIKNKIGEGISPEAFLNVLYPSLVEVVEEASTDVAPFKLGNITLTCKNVQGPPLTLISWFINDQPLEDHNLHQLNAKRVLISSEVTIIEVNEKFSENFTCQGINKAGIRSKSSPKEIKFIYPNISTNLTQEPLPAIKGQQVILKCSVDAPNSENLSYIWFKDGYPIHQLNTSQWIIPKVSLEARRNISCVATNHKRTSTPGYISVNVEAPPTFIEKPEPYQGVNKITTPYVKLTCRVECHPLCSINWFKNNDLVQSDNVESRTYSSDYLRNDFESVESILTISSDHLDEETLSKYTCISGEISASVVLGLEYPPRNLQVSSQSVRVKENEAPPVIKCSGEGMPSLNYRWKKTSTNQIVAQSDVLVLGKLMKSEEGKYTCEGFNRHGNQSVEVDIHVYNYRPVCSIEYGDYRGQKVLICNADTDYNNASFEWKSESSDDAVESLQSIDFSLRSYLVYNSSLDYTKRYICSLENHLGKAIPCQTWLPIPPHNTTVSKTHIDVRENTIPNAVKCGSEGKNVNYVWRKNSNIIAKTAVLQLGKLSRSEGGYYTCEAYNEYGNESINVHFNILYKPSCQVQYDDVKKALICTASANPSELSFIWKFESDDAATLDEINIIHTKERSFLVLGDWWTKKQYRCYASNSVGIGEPCSLE